MGANTFMTKAEGSTASEAFLAAVRAARHEYGHGGYTGTIAEKHSFTLIALPAGSDPERYAYDLIKRSDGRISDKWGPAGCLKLGNGEFLFFGWASS